MIRCIEKAPLAKTFRMLIASVCQFVEIAQELGLGNSCLITILGQLPGDVILRPFLLFNGTVTKDEMFVMSEKERFAWITLESCVLTLFTGSPDLMEAIIRVQDQLAADHQTRK